MFQKYQFDPKIASATKSFGKAFIIEYMFWSIADKHNLGDESVHYFHDGQFYMWDTYETWARRIDWVGTSTIRRWLSELAKDEWIRTAFLHPDKRNRTLFYTLNLDKLSSCMCSYQAHEMCSKRADVLISNTHTKTQDMYPPSAIAPVTHKLKYSEEDLSLANEWIEHARLNVKGKPNSSWTPEKFAEEIAKTKRLAGLTHDDMVKVLHFVSTDSFWISNALSPAGLYKNSKNGSRKVQNILNKMKEQGRGGQRETYLDNPSKYKKGWTPEDGI